MDNKSYQVCLTYYQRWPVRFIAVGYLLACLFAEGNVWSRQDAYRLVAPHISRYDLALDTNKRRVSGLNGLEPELNRWMEDPSQPLLPAIVPRLASVKSLKIIGQSTSDSHLKLLRHTPQLDALNFSVLPRQGLDDVGAIEQLRYLAFDGTRNSEDLRNLSRLSNLETLEIRELRDYLRLFEAIQHLPRLHTLVLPGPPSPDIRFQESDWNAGFRDSDWELLRSLPAMRRVYLTRTWPDARVHRANLLHVQQVLPGIRVSSSAVSDRRPTAWSAIILASGFVWVLIFVQFQMQFSHPGSRMIPGYAGPHLRVAVWLIALTTVVQTFILWQAECSILASLASSVVAPGLFWLWVSLSQRSSNPQTRATSLSPVFVMIFFAPLFSVTMFFSRLFYIDVYWFLEGRYPLIALGLIALSITTHVLVFRQVPRWHNIYEDSGVGLPPLGLNLNAWVAWSKDVAVSQKGRQVVRFERKYTERLDALLTSPGLYGLSHLSIAGNSVGGLQLCWRLLIMVGSFSVGLVLFNSFNLGQGDAHRVPRLFIILMSSMGLDAFSIGLAFHWRKRRPMLSYELLRPNSREGFVRQLFGAVWRDLLPLLIVHPVALGIMAWIFGELQPPWRFLPLAIGYLVFRSLAIYAANLYLLTIRRDWVAILVLQIAWAIVAGAGLYLLGLGTFWQSPQLSVWGIGFYTTGSAMMVFFLVWLKGYWQRIEFA